jgi:hypothetical protein
LSPVSYSAYSQTHSHLLNIKKHKNTDVHTFVASKKLCPDIVLQYSIRTHKVLKCYKLDCLELLKSRHPLQREFDLALNPIAPKNSVTMSHAFQKMPIYNFEKKKLEVPGSKTETLHMILKTYGFANIGGARRTGKSLIYIWKDNTDPELKCSKSGKKAELNLKSNKIEQTC